MTTSDIKPQHLRAALESARKALTGIDAIADEWMLREKTRPAAAKLKAINEHLRELATMLEHGMADPYAVAHDFGLIIAQLMLVDDLRLVKPIFDISTAIHKINATLN